MGNNCSTTWCDRIIQSNQFRNKEEYELALEEKKCHECLRIEKQCTWPKCNKLTWKMNYSDYLAKKRYQIRCPTHTKTRLCNFSYCQRKHTGKYKYEHSTCPTCRSYLDIIRNDIYDGKKSSSKCRITIRYRVKRQKSDIAKEIKHYPVPFGLFDPESDFVRENNGKKYIDTKNLKLRLYLDYNEFVIMEVYIADIKPKKKSKKEKRSDVDHLLARIEELSRKTEELTGIIVSNGYETTDVSESEEPVVYREAA